MEKIEFEFVVKSVKVNVNEEWKWIKGFEGLYEISTLGNVRNNYKQKIRTFETSMGTKVKLKKNGFTYILLVPPLIFGTFYAQPGDSLESVKITKDFDYRGMPALF